MTDETYSDRLHEHARHWRLSVPSPQPLIDDATSPYPNPAVAETLRWRGASARSWAEIDLVTLNGLWSYAARFSQTDRGAGFLPFLKFCEPVPTRDDALADAIAWLRRHEPDRKQTLG